MYGTSVMSSESFVRGLSEDRLKAQLVRLTADCAQERAEEAIVSRLQRRLENETQGKTYVMEPSPSNMTPEERRVWQLYLRRRGGLGIPSMACAYLKAVQDRLEEVRRQPQTISSEPREKTATQMLVSIPWKAIGAGVGTVVVLSFLFRER